MTYLSTEHAQRALDASASCEKPCALVLSPILPTAEEFAPMMQSLQFLSEKGYRLEGEDSLGPGPNLTLTWDELLHVWKTQIEAALKRGVTLLVGFSFGGAIIQTLLPFLEDYPFKLLLFSAPTYIDTLLEHRLNELIQALQQGHTEEALRKLAHYAGSPAVYFSTREEALLETARKRLLFGFQHLLKVDARAAIAQTQHRALHFYGSQSLLATGANIVASSSILRVGVPGAGMRVLADQYEFCHTYLNHFLNPRPQETAV